MIISSWDELANEGAESGVWTHLVLDEKLDTLNGSGSGLRDGGGDTTHCDTLDIDLGSIDVASIGRRDRAVDNRRD